MLSLFLSLILGYGQTGVRLDAFIPSNQHRQVVGRVASDLSGEVWVMTEGLYLFVGRPVYAEFLPDACYIELEGAQDGIPAFALMEFTDGKLDTGYVAIVQVWGSGFGLPGKPGRAYPRRPGSDAVQIYGGGKQNATAASSIISSPALACRNSERFGRDCAPK